MNSELVKTFTPKNNQGESDFRYESDLVSIFESMRPDVLKGLNEFKEKKDELEKEYGSLALEFCINWLEYTDKLTADDTYNKFNYRSKVLRKTLIEGLKDRGFASSKVSKLIGAATLQLKLREGMYKGRREGVNKRFHDMYEFAINQSISSQYLMNGMNYQGIAAAMSYEKDTTQWTGSKTDTFVGEKPSVRVFERLKQQYPTTEDETRGRKRNPLSQLERVSDNDDSIKVIDTEVSVSQEEIAKEIVSLAKQIKPEVWKDQQIISILKQAQSELWNIAHIAALPEKELTTN